MSEGVMGAMGLDEIAKELAEVETQIAGLPVSTHAYDVQRVRAAQRRAELLRGELKRLQGLGVKGEEKP